MRLCHQIRNVKPDHAGIYKCFATNEYGNAVCNATLTVKKGKDGMRRWEIKDKFYHSCITDAFFVL